MWPTRIQDLPRLDRRSQLAAGLLVLALLALTAGFTWLSIRAASSHGSVSSSVVPAPRLWAWDGHGYVQMPATGGGPVSNRVDIAYDRARGALVAWDHGCTRLVMGFTGGCAERVDRTWTWDGRSWEAHGGPRQPAEAGSGSMFFDGIQGTVAYVNGGGALWTWDGAGWGRLRLPGAPAVPEPGSPTASGFAAGYDDAHRELVYALADRTWTYDGHAWTSQAASLEPGDLGGGGRLVNDGDGLLYLGRRSTWTWDGSRWTAHSQPGIASAGLAFDGARVVAVGEDASIWSWSNGAWSQAVVPKRPEVKVSGVPPVASGEATGVTLVLL